MATAERNRCVTCRKDRATLRCVGCLEDFCADHMVAHREMLSTHLSNIQAAKDRCRQTINDQKTDPPQHPLLQEINQWERDAIGKIQRTAEDARENLRQHTSDYMKQMEIDLRRLTDQLERSRIENNFHEINLREWNEQLQGLSQKLSRPANIYLREDLRSRFINKIHVDVRSLLRCPTEISAYAKWIQTGVTVVGENRSGNKLKQLHSPDGIYVDDDLSIYVADYTNDRIMRWEKKAKSGQAVVGENTAAHRSDRLLSPTDVVVDKTSDSLIISEYNNGRVVRWARQNGRTLETIIPNVSSWGICLDNNGYLYVSDHQHNEVKRWKIGDTDGVVVAGGKGKGNQLDQLNGPTHIFVDNDHSVYVSDMKNHRVMKWLRDAQQGSVVAGGHGLGGGLQQLYSPFGVAADQSGNVYVVDRGNHRIVRWLKGATNGTIVVGRYDPGNQSKQLSSPAGLSFDRHGNLYVADEENHRVQKFMLDYNSNP